MNDYEAQIASQPHVDALRFMAMRLYGGDDSIYRPSGPGKKTWRDVVVTPYLGAYGLAGYVIAINGSPPRGSFVTAAYRSVIYIKADGYSRKMSKDQACIVWKYLEEEGYRCP